MKSDFEKKFFRACICVGITLVLVYIAISVVGFAPSAFIVLWNFILSFFDMLMPVVIGLVIAYLLYGPVNAIERFLTSRKHFFVKKKGGCRAIGIVITYVCVIGIIFLMVLGSYYMIGGQISKSTTINNITKTLNEYFSNNTISAESIQAQIEKYNLPFSDILSNRMEDIAGLVSNFTSWLVSFIFGSAINIGSNLFTWVMGLILSVYFLQSSEYFKKLWRKTFYMIFRNTVIGKNIKHALYVINYTFSNYIRGQLIEAFAVGVLSTLVLYIIGVDYAIVIGVIAGITNLIPYVGPFVGTLLAGIIALLSGDLWLCIWAIIGMQIVQQIDGNILCPMIVGDIVGLQPALIIIAILIGGDYAGLLGMLVAVPICASAKTLIGEWYEARFGAGFEASEIQHDIEVAAFKEKYSPKKEKKKLFSSIKSKFKFKKKIDK